ncbi:hypothetical protein EJ02DRAFT_429169, partial [Clathrospora elynae]
MRFPLLLSFVAAATVTAGVQLGATSDSIEILGIDRNDIEIFLGIPYAQDTSGKNRFKPPVPFAYTPNSVIDATKPGPA